MEIYIWATLVVGFIAGILGQRSRMCSIGGMRDLYLIKDSYLFKGMLAFIIAAAVGYIFFNNGVAFPWALHNGVMSAIPGAPCITGISGLSLAIIGGLGVGFFAVLAGGCPFRQTVMMSEGKTTAVFYLIGFTIGAIIFHMLISDAVKFIFGC